MTELERARAHLRNCQHDLQNMRSYRWMDCAHEESAVLAALSWVWEEQEKAREENKAEFRMWLDGIIAERFP